MCPELVRPEILRVMLESVAIVGVKDRPPFDKVTPDYFLPPFEQYLGVRGFLPRHFTYEEFAGEPERHRAAILFYSEGKATAETRELIVRASTAASMSGTPVVN